MRVPRALRVTPGILRRDDLDEAARRLRRAAEPPGRLPQERHADLDRIAQAQDPVRLREGFRHDVAEQGVPAAQLQHVRSARVTGKGTAERANRGNQIGARPSVRRHQYLVDGLRLGIDREVVELLERLRDQRRPAARDVKDDSRRRGVGRRSTELVPGDMKDGLGGGNPRDRLLHEGVLQVFRPDVPQRDIQAGRMKCGAHRKTALLSSLHATKKARRDPLRQRCLDTAGLAMLACPHDGSRGFHGADRRGRVSLAVLRHAAGAHSPRGRGHPAILSWSRSTRCSGSRRTGTKTRSRSTSEAARRSERTTATPATCAPE